MAFKKLESFNLAILAISGQVAMEDNIQARVTCCKSFKRKYLKFGDAMEVRVRDNALLMQKSLSAAREVFKSGIKWRIGNGTNIKIQKDKWMPTSSTFKIQSPTSVLDEEAKVKEFFLRMGKNEKPINQRQIAEIFWDQEASTILSIPINQRGNKDKMIWSLTTKSFFTVKSTYNAYVQLKMTNLGESSYHEEQGSKWKLI